MRAPGITPPVASLIVPRTRPLPTATAWPPVGPVWAGRGALQRVPTSTQRAEKRSNMILWKKVLLLFTAALTFRRGPNRHPTPLHRAGAKTVLLAAGVRRLQSREWRPS